MRIETIQRLKLLVMVVVIVGVLVWNSDSIYRVAIISALSLTVMFVSVRRHENMVKRTFEQHGFRHVAFHSVFGGPELPSVWWHTYIEKHGAVSCATGEKMEFMLAIEGITWALFRPTMTCRVSLVEDQTSEEISHVLESLRDLKCLNYLDCQQSNISDDDLSKLKALQSVELLSLRDTSTTDAALESVKQLTNLQHLDLTRTKITDAGLKQLKDMKSLRDLDLSRTHITDVGLKHLQDFCQLESLDLSHTGITDAGLEYLKNVTNLKVLSLTHTQISDQGLPSLTRMSLSEIYLTDSNTTIEGQRTLQNALPHCRVFPLAWDS